MADSKRPTTTTRPKDRASNPLVDYFLLRVYVGERFDPRDLKSGAEIRAPLVFYGLLSKLQLNRQE
ncbi:MAG: hypothetical protein ABR928_11745 [Terracidiphilus sp.]